MFGLGILKSSLEKLRQRRRLRGAFNLFEVLKSVIESHLTEEKNQCLHAKSHRQLHVAFRDFRSRETQDGQLKNGNRNGGKCLGGGAATDTRVHVGVKACSEVEKLV